MTFIIDNYGPTPKLAFEISRLRIHMLAFDGTGRGRHSDKAALASCPKIYAWRLIPRPDSGLMGTMFNNPDIGRHGGPAWSGGDPVNLVSSAEVLHVRVRADTTLRRAGNWVQDKYLERATSLLRANGPALKELAGILGSRGRVSFDKILGVVMTVRGTDNLALPPQVAENSQP